jgi:cullin 3
VEDLSLFIDEKLRRGSKEVSEDSLERCLQDALSLFCLLEDKDMFERYFRQHLAKRLLHIRAAVEGSEDLVVSRLFMECGHGFTAKLEGMHKDIKLSKDVMDSFTAFLAKQANPPGFQAINVRILTAGCWPLKETARCNLPEEIRSRAELSSHFEMDYYECLRDRLFESARVPATFLLNGP